MSRPPVPCGLSALRTRLLDEHLAGARRVVLVEGPGSDLGGEVISRVEVSPVRLGAGDLDEGLPVDDGSVQAVVAELVMMWVEDPGRAAREIHRVLVPGGKAILTAEPDYQAAIEHPPEAGVHGLVAGVLRKRGADPASGRRLREIFAQDLWETEIHLHVPDPAPGPAGGDLDGLVRSVRATTGGSVDGSVLDRWEAEARRASREGTLFLYVPCFALVACKRP